MLLEGAARILAIKALDVEPKIKDALQSAYEAAWLEWSRDLGTFSYLGELLVADRMPAYESAFKELAGTNPIAPIWEVFSTAIGSLRDNHALGVEVGMYFMNEYSTCTETLKKYRLQL